jgi:hypothetical protein
MLREIYVLEVSKDKITPGCRPYALQIITEFERNLDVRNK